MSILTDALKDNVFKSNERDQRIIDGLNVSNQVLKESNRKLRIDSMVVLGKLNSIQFESSITKVCHFDFELNDLW